MDEKSFVFEQAEVRSNYLFILLKHPRNPFLDTARMATVDHIISPSVPSDPVQEKLLFALREVEITCPTFAHVINIS